MTEDRRLRQRHARGSPERRLGIHRLGRSERSPEFQELVTKRRSFVVPATVFFLTWYFGFVLLAGYAPDFMGESIYEGLTVGYVLALSQFVMVWGLGWLYLRKADRDFDPLAEKRGAARDRASASRRASG